MGVKVRPLAGSAYKVKWLNKFYSLSYVIDRRWVVKKKNNKIACLKLGPIHWFLRMDKIYYSANFVDSIDSFGGFWHGK